MNDVYYLKDRGLVSCYEDYLNLPTGVLEDAFLLGEGIAVRQRREDAMRRVG